MKIIKGKTKWTLDKSVKTLDEFNIAIDEAEATGEAYHLRMVADGIHHRAIKRMIDGALCAGRGDFPEIKTLADLQKQVDDADVFRLAYASFLTEFDDSLVRPEGKGRATKLDNIKQGAVQSLVAQLAIMEPTLGREASIDMLVKAAEITMCVNEFLIAIGEEYTTA
jgi:hypothetical protein